MKAKILVLSSIEGTHNFNLQIPVLPRVSLVVGSMKILRRKSGYLTINEAKMI